MRYLLAFVFCLAFQVQAESFEAKVLAVIDGDTVFVKSGPFKTKLRLVNIDAPEKDQPFGQASQKSLQSLIGGKVVRVESRAVDKFGRTIAVLRIGDINVNEEQVRRGMAWANSRSREGGAYAALQREAQLAKRGLWQQANPQLPSQWRKLHPSVPVKHSAKSQHDVVPQSEKPAKFGGLECGKKNYCSQMVTCDEAHFYLTVCGVERLDTNKDGIPCESLCGVLE